MRKNRLFFLPTNDRARQSGVVYLFDNGVRNLKGTTSPLIVLWVNKNWLPSYLLLPVSVPVILAAYHIGQSHDNTVCLFVRPCSQMLSTVLVGFVLLDIQGIVVGLFLPLPERSKLLLIHLWLHQVLLLIVLCENVVLKGVPLRHIFIWPVLNFPIIFILPFIPIELDILFACHPKHLICQFFLIHFLSFLS
jgi:hypothetical protein